MFRNLKRMGRWIVIAVAIGLLCSSAALAKKPPKPPGGGGGGGTSYTIVKLDDEDENGTWECYARDVNNLGGVVGKAETRNPPEQRAAYWSVSGSGGDIQSQLSLLTGGSRADGINDAGEIVGYGNDSTGQNVGLYWAHAGAEPLPLLPLSGDLRSCAKAINNQGVVCGYSAHTGGRQAVAWRINWTNDEASVWGPIELAMPDGSLSLAGGINNNDENGHARIVGHFSEPPWVADPTAAVAWTVQAMPDGTLTAAGPEIVEDGLAKALGVNDVGTICGEAGPPTVPVVWIGTDFWPLDLARARDIVDGSALDINNNGAIVGCGSSGMIDDEAVAWPSAEAKMVRLNKYVGRKSLFIFLVEASAVNDSGEIVGFGFTEVGGSGDAAFLAIPQ